MKIKSVARPTQFTEPWKAASFHQPSSCWRRSPYQNFLDFRDQSLSFCFLLSVNVLVELNRSTLLGSGNCFVKALKGFNLGENWAYVMVTYLNTITVFFCHCHQIIHSSFISVLCLSLAQPCAHELEWRISLLFSVTLHPNVLGCLDPALHVLGYLNDILHTFLLYCIWLVVSKSTGSLRCSDKLILSLCFLGIPLIHLLENNLFLKLPSILSHNH